MTGTAISNLLAKKHKIIAPPKYQLNLGNLDQINKLKETEPDFIIHLAAETDHEYCDINPAQCYFINTIATGHLMRIAKERNIPILYLAAGSIFDGKKKRPYTTFDEPNPMNHYNISKWYGELLVKEWSRHYIIRAGWMFGGGPSLDKKFVNKLYTKIRSGQKEILVADDCIGSPTYTEDLALAVRSMVEDKAPFGTYHCANRSGDRGVSRYEFARMMVKYLRSRVRIIPCKIDDLKAEFPCKRTNYEVLFNNCPSMRGWTIALEEYIHDQYRS